MTAAAGTVERHILLTPIGRIRTPYPTIADCPRNGRQRQPPPDCVVEVDEPFRPALDSIEGFSHLILLYWLGPQTGALTVTPAFDGQPHGTFATRTPNRPNPIGLSVVSLHAVGPGHLVVRNLDCADGTPLLDIKPYLPSTDAEPAAAMGWLSPHRTPA